MSGAARFRNDILDEDTIKDILEAVDKSALSSWASNNGTEKGQGFLGDIAEVSVETESGSKHRWMIKLLKPVSKGLPDLARSIGAFDREANYYDKIASRFKTIDGCLLPKIPRFVSLRREYSREFIALEHMGDYGFRGPAVSIADGFDLSHSRLIVENLALVHAHARAVVESHPRGPEGWLEDNPWAVPLSQGKNEKYEKWQEGTKMQTFRNFMMMMEKIQEGDESLGFPQRLEKVAKGVDYRLSNLRYVTQNRSSFCFVLSLSHDRTFSERPRFDDFCTLCHMDTWFNNMLFRYSDNKVPNAALLLDFQFVAFCNPVRQHTCPIVH